MRRSRRRRRRGCAPWPVGYALSVVVLDLALRDFLEGDREVVLRPRLDHRGRELVKGPLTEVVVVRVDLSRALGGDDHTRVRVVVRVREELVDAGGDHPAEDSFARTMPSRASSAS